MDFTPTYEAVVGPADPWCLIAPYVTSARSLLACARVSRHLHDVFAATLWRDPSSLARCHDDCDDGDAVLARFFRSLPAARLSTRRHVTTLRLSRQSRARPGAMEAGVAAATPPPLDTSDDAWLARLLLLLPNLQALYAGGLPCIDHKSLLALGRLRPGQGRGGRGGRERASNAGSESDAASESESHPLRLLDLRDALNVTGPALCAAAAAFPRLVYLDCFGCSGPAVRSHDFLRGLAALRELKALKLRGAGLRDAEAQVLACAVGRRLRLLDVSGNRLTEAGWAWLLQRCFRRGRASAGGSTGDASRNKHDVHSATLHDDIDCEPDYYYEWSASPSPHANRLTARSLRSAHLERDLRLQLSEPLTGRSSFADHIPWTGITHVAVGENSPPISPAMLATLVSAGGLYSLDVGPAAASLASGLFEFPGAKTLRYLRVHFDAIVDTRISEGDECHAVPRAGEWCYTPPSIDKLLQRRPQLHGPASLQPPLLHPSWLPRLETLVLTSVPRRSPQPQSRVLVNALGHFITACGDEATLSQISSREASSTAHRHPHDYASPPRPFPFSLRRIVLETTESDGHVFVSSTEDPDSERLWRQAAGDFSFFRDEAVYSAPGLSPSSSLPPGQPYARDGVEAGRGLAQPLVDTVAELAAWRRAKREEYARAAQQARADGLHRLYVKGYWAGEVSVVRAAAGGR